jgi:hypothetical protein
MKIHLCFASMFFQLVASLREDATSLRLRATVLDTPAGGAIPKAGHDERGLAKKVTTTVAVRVVEPTQVGCADGVTMDSLGNCCGVGETTVGGFCCAAGVTAVNSFQRCCQPGQTAASTPSGFQVCCAPGTTAADNKANCCRVGETTVNGVCCAASVNAVDSSGKCCQPGQIAATSYFGYNHCCPPDTQVASPWGECCPPNVAYAPFSCSW